VFWTAWAYMLLSDSEGFQCHRSASPHTALAQDRTVSCGFKVSVTAYYKVLKIIKISQAVVVASICQYQPVSWQQHRRYSVVASPSCRSLTATRYSVSSLSDVRSETQFECHWGVTHFKSRQGTGYIDCSLVFLSTNRQPTIQSFLPSLFLDIQIL
jgi:hypothetical protein